MPLLSMIARFPVSCVKESETRKNVTCVLKPVLLRHCPIVQNLLRILSNIIRLINSGVILRAGKVFKWFWAIGRMRFVEYVLRRVLSERNSLKNPRSFNSVIEPVMVQWRCFPSLSKIKALIMQELFHFKMVEAAWIEPASRFVTYYNLMRNFCK